MQKKKIYFVNHLLKFIYDVLWIFVGSVVWKEHIPEEIVKEKEEIFLPVKLRIEEEEE